MLLFLACVALSAAGAAAEGAGAHQEVSKLPLNSGASMPMVGLGTWQVTSESELDDVLDAALQAGYRHFDTATIYRNEHLIGKALSRWLKDGKVKREDLFITTKLPLYGMSPEEVPFYLNQSLSQLQTDYVDLYLIHMPFGIKRSAWESSNPANAADPTTDLVAIWKAMETQKKEGRAKAIGVSNFNETQIERLIKAGEIPPANLQVELHLYHQQKPLVEFCKKHGITVTAYSPLGSPGSAWVSKSTGKPLPDLLGLEAVKKIAAHHNKTAAQVLLRYTVQRGIIVIPKSSKPHRLQENIKIFDFTLSESEMAELAALDKGWEGKIFDMKNIGNVKDHPEYPWPALL